MQSHIRKVYACLAVTCHLHFWQTDRDLLRATAVTRGWNGYRNLTDLTDQKCALGYKIADLVAAAQMRGTRSGCSKLAVALQIFLFALHTVFMSTLYCQAPQLDS